MLRLRRLTRKRYDWRGVAALSAAILVASLGVTTQPALAEEKGLPIAAGRSVTIEYSLTLSDETELASNVGKEPLAYVQGESQILPGLEKALHGMRVGQKKHVEIPAAEAYGAYDEKARLTIGRSQVPEDIAAGSILSSPDGPPVKVLEVSDEEVVLDVNHPLAGKDLVFDVKVISVEEAKNKPSNDESRLDWGTKGVS